MIKAAVDETLTRAVNNRREKLRPTPIARSRSETRETRVLLSGRSNKAFSRALFAGGI